MQIFFKHSEKKDNFPDANIEFNSELSECFLIFSLMGIESLELKKNSMELAFTWWHLLNNPSLINDEGGKELIKNVSVHTIDHLRSLNKIMFLDAFLLARTQHGFKD